MTWCQGRAVRRYFFHSKMQTTSICIMFLHSIKSLIKKQVTGYLLLLWSPQDLPSSCRRKLVWLEELSTDQRCLLSGASLQFVWGFIPVPVGSESYPTAQLFPSTSFPFFINITSSLLFCSFLALPLFLMNSLNLLEIKLVVLTAGIKRDSYPSIAIFSICACTRLLYFFLLIPPISHLLSACCLLVFEVKPDPRPREVHPLLHFLSFIWN